MLFGRVPEKETVTFVITATRRELDGLEREFENFVDANAGEDIEEFGEKYPMMLVLLQEFPTVGKGFPFEAVLTND